MSSRTLNLTETIYQYLLNTSLREHPAQVALREATRTHPYATMQISPEQGQFMAMLVRLIGARRTIGVHGCFAADRGVGLAGRRQRAGLRYQKIDPENPGIVDRHSVRRSENKWLERPANARVSAN